MNIAFVKCIHVYLIVFRYMRRNDFGKASCQSSRKVWTNNNLSNYFYRNFTVIVYFVSREKKVLTTPSWESNTKKIGRPPTKSNRHDNRKTLKRYTNLKFVLVSIEILSNCWNHKAQLPRWLKQHHVESRKIVTYIPSRIEKLINSGTLFAEFG